MMGSELKEEQKEHLTKLFKQLNRSGTGYIDVREFQLLGYAIQGTKPTMEEAKVELDRADLDEDGKLSLEEWLDFSKPLCKVERYDFERRIDSYIRKVHEEQQRKK